MPLVEVIGTSRSHARSGWAYVPDTTTSSFQPSNPSAKGRKRGIREPGGRTDLTSRQNHAILRHLAELDRENHRDNVHIPVPVRKDAVQRDNGRTARAKTTSNVRRILQSQKTFKNYLDDEEAALAHQSTSTSTGGGGVGGAAAAAAAAAGVGTPVSKVAKIAARRSVTPIAKQGAAAATAPPKEGLSDRQKRAMARKSVSSASDAVAGTPASKKQKGKAAESKEEPTATTTTTTTAADETQKEDSGNAGDDAMQIDSAEPSAEPIIKGLIKSPHDDDHLLKSYIPKPPSDRLMAALLAEPPLRYHAARAAPSSSGKPPRSFCTICGYWGKIKCRNCGVRTCGLECYKVHEDSRCGAFF